MPIPPSVPVSAESGERIESLDWLRGVALLGMFIVHFHMRTTEPGGVDDLIRTAIWRLVESKSHGTFALLFGAGFAIQLRRAEARGMSLTGRYLRRLAVLAAFGFAAHAFFGFNVLLGYAVWGVPLLFLRTWSTRALVLAAVLSAASVPIYRFATGAWLHFMAGPEAVEASMNAQRTAAVAVNGALRSAEAADSYRALVAARLAHMRWFYAQPFSFLPGATLALFITGLLLVRHRVFDAPHRHLRLLAGFATFGLVAWAVDIWVWPARTWGLLRDQWLTFTYVSLALMILAHAPQVLARTRPVADAGRMALTNYLLQIALLDLVFSGYALGVGRIRPVIGLTLAILCFAAEAAASTWWLARFKFGPAEWLWRSLTYGARQPMRRPRGEPAPATKSPA